jgi:hypothetical protein
MACERASVGALERNGGGAAMPFLPPARAKSDRLENILSELGITAIACNETAGPMRTRAANVIRRVLDEYGEGHLILVLRTITESEGNEAMLIQPVIEGLSDILMAHPSWGDRGLAWIEAFDNINLKELAAKAKANRKACRKRAAIAALVHDKLSPLFDPPKKARPPRKEYVYKRGPRKPKIEQNAGATT